MLRGGFFGRLLRALGSTAGAAPPRPSTQGGRDKSGALRFVGQGRKVSPVTNDRIEINPKVLFGKPVIRGTRIPVELVVRKLSEGVSQQDLLDGYPRLAPADIQAALRYAADTLAHETLLVLSTAA